MRKTHDLCVKYGTYTDRNGNTKNQYVRVGYVMQEDGKEPFEVIFPYINFAGFPRDSKYNNVIISRFSSDKNNNQNSQNQNFQQSQFNSSWNGENFNEHVQHFDNMMANGDMQPEQIPF